ncbi:hypothetical protein FRC00_013982 [Tulasnella sp. 408]|nr:hypothetical protein FRC00_013982 [Tulasnella sp. 408]
MIDSLHNIHTYPKAASQQKLESASHMTFIFPSTKPSQVAGYRLSESGRSGSSSQLSARQTWSMSFGDEFIHEFIKPKVSPIAAGNDTATSNSSNRNLVGIVSSAQGSTELVNCVVRVVDGTKGTLVYRAELGSGRCEDVRGIFIGDTANPEVQIQQRTFAVGFQPQYLATTFTKYGIALQDLIVATDKDQIISLPNRLLHTLGAAPQSAQGSSAAIPPSANVVQDEPRITISQIWQVSDVQGILSTSSQLESTSLVFAYGRDLFATTVEPSATFDLLSKDFGRSQLLATLAVLVAAVLMTKPLAQNREQQRQWFSS